MQLYALGINYRSAPLSLRERVAFHSESLALALHDLIERRPVKEAAILSTCNRTELYCNTVEPDQVVDWLAGYHRVAARTLTPHLYALPREQAVKHAFRVASGLDSMVLGEPQILGQMKQAVKTAEQAGTLGALLHQLFQRSFSVAKEVRSSTDIGAQSVSMAAASVRLAQRLFENISEQNVLLIGAGQMIELCATHMAAQHPRRITIANRTLERGSALAKLARADAIALSEVPEQLAAYDIVIACTASSLPILGKGLVERAIKARKRQPMLMIDLAVPRDIEAEVAQLEDVFLYTIDDMRQIVEAGVGTRATAAAKAEAIVATRVEGFLHWMETRESVPTIRALRDHTDRLRRLEVARAQRLLEKGEDPQRVLEVLSEALINKFLHAPHHALSHATGQERTQLEALLRRLYKLHHE
ncbi:MAG: glutamyl-tRNA reductase [Burkholderiales bacterium]